MLALALVAMACAIGVPATAMAADALADALPPDGDSSWEPVASSCAADEDGLAGKLALEPICEIVAIDPDEDGFFAAAPLCDPSGTSAIAPQPIHPIGNDRIEATPSCDDLPSTFARDRGNDETPQRPVTTMDHALLPDLIPPPRWWGVVSEAGSGRLLGPAEGTQRQLEHPPHGG